MTELAKRFEEWADHAHRSPLCRHLILQAAHDPEILELASEFETPLPQNLLLASVQLLLEPGDDLARWYPSRRTDAVPPDEDTYPAFRSFVFDHRDEIVELGRTKHVQTNEPRRCAVVLPYLAQEADRLGEPVHVIEIGASAGLNLCFDKYAYRYTSGTTIGHSTLVLEAEDRGLVPVPERTPFVQHRVGIDLHPVDVTDPAEVAWLDALVWPEHAERRRRLATALAIRRTEKLEMVRGDASAVISGVARRLPTGGPLLIWHSFTLNQFTAEQRDALDAAVSEIARRRSVSRIGWEYWDRNQAWPEVRVGLTRDSMRSVARGHPHGEWVEAI